MAPSAETVKDGVIGEEDGRLDQISGIMNLKRNVTFAVNYEVSMVHQFLASKVTKRRSSAALASDVETVPAATPNSPRPVLNALRRGGGGPKKENNAPNVSPPPEPNSAMQLDNSDPTTPNNNISNSTGNNTMHKRRSAREKKKDVTLSRIRVRYDMQLVPPTNRNRAFLQSYPIWWMRHGSSSTAASAPEGETTQAPARRSSRLTTSAPAVRASTDITEQPLTSSCKYCTVSAASRDSVLASAATPSSTNASPDPAPFELDETVLWIPTKRSEWEDSVSEMTAVCASAAIRRYLQTQPSCSPSKPFHAPLSRDYIRDRVDIDDPLNGFQLRHRAGGWLQGFLMWTRFTTWCNDFQWNSLHPSSGFSAGTITAGAVDVDGSLAAQLEAQERSGNPHENGIVFPSIAEIALVGGLGCGEYLLRLALEDIRAAGTYKFVVLQATDQSKSFYERYGFVRVGAVCRYRVPGSGGNVAAEEEPMEGYRHWTHANESEKSLKQHGGPSYMMCLPLPPVLSGVAESCTNCGGSQLSFMDRMMALAVNQKPTIEPLGSSLTPGPKPLRRNSIAGGEIVSGPSLVGPVKKKVGRRNSVTPRVGTKRKSMTSTSPKASDVDIVVEAAPKRRKLHNKSPTSRERLLSPPPSGSSLTYAQKQYQSVWLAVPPASAEAPPSARPPPKSRLHHDPSFSSHSVRARTYTARAKKQLSTGLVKSALDKDGKLRALYAVRSNEGRFSTIPYPPPQGYPPLPFPIPSSSSSTPKKSFSKDVPSNLPLPSELELKKPNAKPTRIDKDELMKQKVKSYPRSRLHFYNRVVKSKESGSCSSSRGSPQYYFVLQYSEPSNALRLVPMAAKGHLTGKREGRPRFQVVLEDTDANFRTVSADDYEVVPATMVMKTPVVANEAWDVEDD